MASKSKNKAAAQAESVVPAKPRKPVTHYVVVATQARVPDSTEYAKNGDVLTAEQLGDMAKLHLEREAIRPATAEEIEAFEEGNAEEAKEAEATE